MCMHLPKIVSSGGTVLQWSELPLRRSHRKRRHLHLAAQRFGRVVEDSVAISHEELPAVVERKRSSEGREALAISAVGKCGGPVGPGPDIRRRAQPHLLSFEGDAGGV